MVLSYKSEILFYLRKNYKSNNTVLNSDIIRDLGLKKGRVSSALSELKKEGLIRTFTEGRTNRVKITFEGILDVESVLVKGLRQDEIEYLDFVFDEKE